MGRKPAIILPAPLRYRYDKQEWWSIYTNSIYERVIPWYRRLKHWPLFPVLLDNIAIRFKSVPKVGNKRKQKIRKNLELGVGIIGKLQ